MSSSTVFTSCTAVYCIPIICIDTLSQDRECTLVINLKERKKSKNWEFSEEMVVNIIFTNIYLAESSTKGIPKSGPKAFEIPKRYLKGIFILKIKSLSNIWVCEESDLPNMIRDHPWQ